MTALALAGTTATIALAYTVSAFVASVFDGNKVSPALLPMFLAAVGFKFLQSWLQEFLAVRAASSAKQELRSRLVKASWINPSRSSAELGVLAGRGLDALDPYFAKYLPQLVYTAIVTPILIAVFWLTDLASGITLLATVPLIPLFMVLIGWATAELQKKQFESLSRLAGHFAEILKSLGTLRLFGRAKKQETTIAEVSKDLRIRTMKVLRISFLSGFTLELIASLSVALIAVSIGMRLVNSQIPFGVALFLLILAPEVFLPLRAVGANFHAASEGVAAAAGVLEYLSEPAEPSIQNSEPFELGEGLTLIHGPSGAGKSSLFGELLGFAPEQSRFAWMGATAESRRKLVAWMPQQPKLGAGSVVENVSGFSVAQKSLLNEALEFAQISEFATLNVENLSGGEAARVNLARAYYRLKLNSLEYLLLDEPTASVDLSTASKIRQNLRKLSREGVRVVVISHEKDYLPLADVVVEIA